jgi:hypothetical protein
MSIDLNNPNAERPAPPTITAPTRKQNRRRSPLAICHTARPIGRADCASSSFELVPEARQTYPTEDDRTACVVIAANVDIFLLIAAANRSAKRRIA